MQFRIPEALAGSDNEVEMDGRGARKVIELVAGTAVGAGIIAAGAYLYKRAAERVGAQESPMEGLY